LQDADHTTLLCFSSDVGEWVEKEVAYPFPPWQLAPNCVVSHSGRLWFVDLSWCLITCDPFASTPALRFVPLQPGKELRCREAWGVLDRYCCVRVSAGKLQFVDMYKANAPHQRGPHHKISGGRGQENKKIEERLTSVAYIINPPNPGQ
jgi:hypothetical protein